MSTPLLATKLHIPVSRAELVARPSLVERLNNGLGRKLTLISAPAGYGKTTLLSAWIQSLTGEQIGDGTLAMDAAATPRFGWLSLDEGDNDLARFLAYWIAALRMADPAIDPGIAPMFASPALVSAEPVMTALINDLAARPGQLVIILDDYHLINEPSIHQALDFWLDHQPAWLHLVIAGRADPPLATARLRARGQLAELRQEDLCFTPDEATAFLERVGGLSLSQQEVAALASRTEGWIAGLQLAAASMQGIDDQAAFIKSFTGSNRFILDYLLSEVLERQSTAVQAFLLQTSILKRLSGPLCDAVIEEQVLADTHDSQKILEYLERSNLFLLPLDAERSWYRYHQLFADLLRKQLGLTWPAMVSMLHRRASAWLEAHNLPYEAIDHALEAEDFERAALMMENVVEEILLHTEVTTLQNWLERLPQEILHSHPTLCLYQSWVLLIMGYSLESIEAYADKMAAQGDFPPGQMASLNSVVAAARDDMPASARYAHQALEQLPEGDLFLRSVTARLLGFARLVEGDQAESDQILDEIVRRSQQSGHIANAVSALCYLAELALRRAQLRKARVLYERAISLATDRQGRPHPMTCEAVLGLGAILREMDDFENAERLLTQGIELAFQWRPLEAIAGYGDLARIRQAQGDFSGANDFIQKAHTLAVQIDYIQVDDLIVEMQQARLWVAQKNIQAAAVWALKGDLDRPESEARMGRYPDPISVRLRKYEQLIYARLLLVQGKPAQALYLLESLRMRTKAIGRVALVMECHMLEALAHQALGNMPQALASLDQTLQIAAPEGFVRLFADEGEPMRRLLECKIKDSRGSQIEYLPYLLAACNSAQTPRPTRQAFVQPLSEREMEVLRLLATSLPTSEIAASLYIAESTLRSHTKRIYAKLDAHSRLEAIQHAEDLGLLPS
jgi:LuxR family maltose regulon positive regulatory protein